MYRFSHSIQYHTFKMAFHTLISKSIPTIRAAKLSVTCKNGGRGTKPFSIRMAWWKLLFRRNPPRRQVAFNRRLHCDAIHWIVFVDTIPWCQSHNEYRYVTFWCLNARLIWYRPSLCLDRHIISFWKYRIGLAQNRCLSNLPTQMKLIIFRLSQLWLKALRALKAQRRWVRDKISARALNGLRWKLLFRRSLRLSSDCTATRSIEFYLLIQIDCRVNRLSHLHS